ncbi:tetraspanin-10 [Neovison vison]|uniref:tetraspanin-10 n=1 Tax=Neovison vison TaxID=452646 RepID=UPI001CF0A6E9|nr:tetraspanin-10 [Neogale vison]
MAAAPVSGLEPRAAAAAACRPAGLEASAPASAPASRRRRHRRSSFAAGRHRRATSGASSNALRRPRSPETEFRPSNGPRMRKRGGRGPGAGRGGVVGGAREGRRGRARAPELGEGRLCSWRALLSANAGGAGRSEKKQERACAVAPKSSCWATVRGLEALGPAGRLRGDGACQPASSPLPGSDPSLEDVTLPVDYPILPVRSPRVLPLPPQDASGQEEALPVSSPLTASRQAPQEDQLWRAGLGGDRASSLPLGSSCLKYLIFLFNFLFSLLGALALAFGLWGLAVKGSLRGSGGAALPEDALLGLALGGLAVSAVSLAGCLGAFCENACLLRCFSGGLIAFLALEAVVGSLLVALWGPLQDGLEPTLRAAITHYQDDADLRFLIDQVQLGLQCCGVSSYRDWTRNPSFNCSSAGAQACGLPASCCISPRGDGVVGHDPCGFGALGPDEAVQRRVHLEGCGLALRGWLRANVRAAGAWAIATVVVQGLELLLAARLVRALAVRQGVAGSPRTVGTERSPAKLAQG